MNIRIVTLLIATHITVSVFGFAVGIYVLPILIAPPAPSEAAVKAMSSQARYSTQFRRDLKDSDSLHWGEGKVSITSKSISLMGKLAPGPDYKLYLSPAYVETEAGFNRLKSNMVRVGDVKTFDNFVVEIPAGIEPSNFNSVIIWCEAFGQFITSAKYR